jgi:hypothetical protein
MEGGAVIAPPSTCRLVWPGEDGRALLSLVVNGQPQPPIYLSEAAVLSLLRDLADVLPAMARVPAA